MDKNKLEQNIAKTAKEIFAIPKENHNSSCDFLSLKTKLSGYVWQWAELTWKTQRIRNCSCEIMECVNRCLSSYDGSPENFIKYISAAVKNEIERTNKKAADKDARPITIPEKKGRIIKYIIRYIEDSHLSLNDESVKFRICSSFNISPEEFTELMMLYRLSFPKRDIASSYGDNDIFLFTTATIFDHENYKDAETEVIQADELNRLLDTIERTFLDLQERIKPYLSALITRQLLQEMEKAGIETDIALGYLSRRNFAVTPEGLRVKEFLCSGDNCPTQQEVAAWFGRDKSDASRTLRGFLKKLQG